MGNSEYADTPTSQHPAIIHLCSYLQQTSINCYLLGPYNIIYIMSETFLSWAKCIQNGIPPHVISIKGAKVEGSGLQVTGAKWLVSKITAFQVLNT